VAALAEPMLVLNAPAALDEVPTADALCWDAEAEVPTAVEELPLAVAKAPTTVAELPLAVAEAPTAVAEVPLALDEAPTAVASEELAVAFAPHSVERGLMALLHSGVLSARAGTGTKHEEAANSAAKVPVRMISPPTARLARAAAKRLLPKVLDNKPEQG
jgi:hypothetical protein